MAIGRDSLAVRLPLLVWIGAACACTSGCGVLVPMCYDASLKAHVGRGGLVGKRYVLTQDVLVIREPWKRAVIVPEPRTDCGRARQIRRPARPVGGAWGVWGKRHLASLDPNRTSSGEAGTLAKGTRLKIVAVIAEVMNYPPPVYYVQGRIEEGRLKGTLADVSHVIEERVPPESNWRKLPNVADEQYLSPLVPTEPNRTVPAVLEALHSRHWAVRYRAVQLLGEIKGDPAITVSVLLAAMKDRDSEVQCEAIESLGRIGPAAKAAVPALVEVMKTKDIPSGYSRRAAEALASIGRPLSPALLDALKDDAWPNRFIAAEGLASLGAEAAGALPHLIEFLRSDPPSAADKTPEHIGGAIHRIAGKEGVAAVMELLKDARDNVRGNAARALGEMSPEAELGVPALMEMVVGERTFNRMYAIDALGKLGERATPAIPVLTEAMWDRSEAAYVRARAGQALGRIKPIP